MNITLHIPEPLATRLTVAGANPEHLALVALQQAADELERASTATARETPRRAPAEAAARMRAARASNILPQGVSIRDLMTHGRA